MTEKTSEKPIGRIIREVFDQNGMKLNAFAERIGTTRQNVYKIFEKQSIPTARLRKISEILNYDFFQHLRLEGQGRDTEDTGPRPVRYADLYKELEAARERIAILEERLKDKEEIIELLKSRNQ